MQVWITAEGEARLILAFEFDQKFAIFSFKALHHFWMNDNNEGLLFRFATAKNGAQGALKLDAHGHGGFHLAVAFAVWAGLIEGAAQAFMEALTSHFHEAKLADGEDLSFGLVTLEVLLHSFRHSLLIAAVFHVDKVHDDESTHVTETELTCDFLSGFEIGLDDDAVEVFGAFVSAGVDVDGDERFGLINHDVASAG